MITRNVEVGQTVAANSETPPLLLVAANLTVVHIDANVGETDISKVKRGEKVSVSECRGVSDPSIKRTAGWTVAVRSGFVERRCATNAAGMPCVIASNAASFAKLSAMRLWLRHIVNETSHSTLPVRANGGNLNAHPPSVLGWHQRRIGVS